jgi:hypothetical protein
LTIASPDEQATWIVLNKEYKENKMKDAKALAFIQQRVNKGILPRMQVHAFFQECKCIYFKKMKGKYCKNNSESVIRKSPSCCKLMTRFR